jgi:hypothetical protein
VCVEVVLLRARGRRLWRCSELSTTASVTVHVFAMLGKYFVSVKYVFVCIKLMCVYVKLLKI